MPATDPDHPWSPSRREFLGTLALGLLAMACSSKTGNASPTAPASPTSAPPAAPGSLTDLAKGATQMSVLSGEEPIAPGGAVRFGFAASYGQGQLITGGSPQVWVARDMTSKATGPVGATWYDFTGYGLTGDRSPESPIHGTYAAELPLSAPGNWIVGVRVAGSGLNLFGTAAQPVANGLPNQVGSKATPVRTPVATDDAGLSEICTRTPVCHLHSISLDDALTNGKPTVVVFATPLLCSSRFCGPVTDEVILIDQKHGSKANVIHVEEFLPGPSHTPPAPTLDARSEGFKAWHLESEPFVFVIDTDGTIRASVGPGPSTAPEFEAALTPLL